MLSGQPVKRVVQNEQLFWDLIDREFNGIEIQAAAVASSLNPSALSGFLHENPPHGLSGSGKEMAPTIPLWFGLAGRAPGTRHQS